MNREKLSPEQIIELVSTNVDTKPASLDKTCASLNNQSEWITLKKFRPYKNLKCHQNSRKPNA